MSHRANRIVGAVAVLMLLVAIGLFLWDMEDDRMGLFSVAALFVLTVGETLVIVYSLHVHAKTARAFRLGYRAGYSECEDLRVAVTLNPTVRVTHLRGVVNGDDQGEG